VVEAVTVEPRTLRDVVDLVGQLEAEESVIVRSEIPGVIESIRFEEGAEVAAGALLLTLGDDEQRAALHEAEAARVLAERSHERGRELARDGVLAASELDRLLAERDAARARLEAARIALARTEIHAPFAGMLGARQVSPGDRVTPEYALVQLDAVTRLRLVFTVPETAVPLARAGLPLTARVAAWPEETFPGEVYFVAPSLDPQSRRLLLKAWVPNPSLRLRPGMFANVQAELARRENVLSVPESALVQAMDGTFVWRLQTDGTAARVPVEVGLRQSGRIEIVSGLAAGDRVVSAGTHKVAPGVPLEVVQGGTTGEGATP
jgi:membrane fusion protein (multidrug efflux system)